MPGQSNAEVPPGFGEVLTAWSWWDYPRAGVALIEGQPHRFSCDFDETLDDYPEEDRLGPISDQGLEAELAVGRLWVEWRGQFDAGADPAPFEKTPDYERVK